MSHLYRHLVIGLVFVTSVGGLPRAFGQAASAPNVTPAQLSQDTNKRRQEIVMLCNQALSSGQVFLQAKDWVKAEERFNYVIKMTSGTGDDHNVRLAAQQGLAKAYIAQATDAIAKGSLDDAKNLLDQAEDMDSKNTDLPLVRKQWDAAKRKYEAQHNDPESMENNPAVTPELMEKIANVQRLLFEGDRFFETGQYDKADGRFRQALVIDPYNKAARSRLDKVEKYRMAAAKVAHDTSRDQAMYEVDHLWHEDEKPDDKKATDVTSKSSTETNVAQINYKLTTIKIPEISFNDTPIEDALNQLMLKSREFDPDKEGVNFVIKTHSADNGPATPPPTTGAVVANVFGAASPATTAAAAPAAATGSRNITLNLKDVSLDDALRLVTNLGNLKYKIEEYAVFVLPVTDTASALITRTFTVPPGFFNGGISVPSGTRSIGAPTIRIGGPAAVGPSVDAFKIDVKQQLIDQGIEFPNGSTAAFLAGSSKLVVKNTPEQLDFIEALIEARSKEEPQVEIETKYVEFTETALKELSFNWAMSNSYNVNQLPMIENPDGTLAQPQNAFPGLNDVILPSTSSRTLFGGGTANRTDASQPQNSLDSLLGASLNGTVDTGRASGGNANQLFLGAVLGSNAYGVLATLIDQMQGVDLLSAPKLTVKSHNAGKVEVAREMRYPTNFQAPKFNNNPIQFDGIERILLLPPTPSDFQTETVGVTLDVTPTAYPDRRIDLKLAPKVTDFEGFINYGSTVIQGRLNGPTTPILDLIGGIFAIVGFIPTTAPITSPLATYKLQQPVFNNRSIQTSVQVVDGQTVMLGGLIREDRSDINDKVPLLGDLPLVGRAFQSKSTQTVKRNLVIFVTARLIRSTGKPEFLPSNDDTTLPVTPAAPLSTPAPTAIMVGTPKNS